MTWATQKSAGVALGLVAVVGCGYLVGRSLVLK
jgi:hypothetical protein